MYTCNKYQLLEGKKTVYIRKEKHSNNEKSLDRSRLQSIFQFLFVRKIKKPEAKKKLEGGPEDKWKVHRSAQDGTEADKGQSCVCVCVCVCGVCVCVCVCVSVCVCSYMCVKGECVFV